MKYLSFGSSMGNTLKLLLMVTAIAGAGCIPQNAPLPVQESGLTKTYAGFAGALKAETMSDTKIKVSWAASADPTVIAYNVYDTSNLFAPVLLKTVPAPADSVMLTSLATQKLYSIRVHAANVKAVEDTNVKDVYAIPYGGITAINVLNSTSAEIVFNDGSNADEIHTYCKKNASTTFDLMKSLTNNLTLTKVTLTGLENGATYTCRVALMIGETVDDNPAEMTFTPIGVASQLVFTTQPGSAGAGVALSPQPVVEIRDANNNVVSAGPDSNARIELSIAGTSPSGGLIRGNATATAVKGVAVFSGLNFQEIGVKVLNAAKSDTQSQVNGSPTFNQLSNSFVITAGPVSPITSKIEVTPGSGVVANGSSAYSVKITLADQFGNAIAGIKPKFNSTNGADTITQPTVNTNSSGFVTGSINSTVAGLRTLAIGPDPSGLSSVSIPVTFDAGPPTKFGFTTQPINSPAGVGGLNNISVAVLDMQGNIVTSSTQTVSLSIFLNPGAASLTGTVSVPAIGGIATFVGLGVSATGTGYKLGASMPAPVTLATAYSNSFNVLAGVPSKIGLNSPATVKSGDCSGAVTIKLLDSGNNPANATANTAIALTGMGLGGMYTSSSCSGTAVGASITFTSGSNTKTVYFKDNKAEALTLTASDPSSIMSTGTHAIVVTPSSVGLTGPVTVVSGRCSTAYTLTTSGVNGQAGAVAADTVFSLDGMSTSQAGMYSASDCSGSPLDNTNVVLAAGQATKLVYMKDDKAESFSVGVSDPSGVIQTVSTNIAVNVVASKINFTGPASVVSGKCSAAFTVSLRDATNTAVLAPLAQALKINGLIGTQGNFYSDSGCSGSVLGSTMTISQNSSQKLIYFKDSTAESISVNISDGATPVVLTVSPTINIGVSPSDFAIIAPVAAAAKTNICAGPFRVELRDGAGNATAAIVPISGTLSGSGDGGTFYSGSSCTGPITSMAFTTGMSTQDFYFMSLSPGPLVLQIADAATTPILTTATANWSVVAAKAWLGTGGGVRDWFNVGKFPVQPRVDDAAGVRDIHLDANKEFMYVLDGERNRIIKYNYQTQEYIGWIGRHWKGGGIGIVGSVISPSLNAQCAAVTDGANTPGWCQGGQSQYADSNGLVWGGLSNALRMTDDGTYLYVTNRSYWGVSKFRMDTGEFFGWIGAEDITPSAPGTGLTNNCATIAANNVTPGWCRGGRSANWGQYGDGRTYNPYGIGYSATNGGQGGGPYIYVGMPGAVKRYNADTGQFYGWIGWVNGTAPTGNAPDLPALNCVGATHDKGTPGWCIGGNPWQRNSNDWNGGPINDPSDIYVDEANNRLYVVMSDNGGTISRFNLATGAFVDRFKNSGFNSLQKIVSDGTFFYGADTNRIVKVGIADATIYGWQGKVSNPASMSTGLGGVAGCSALSANQDTPGWCQGGTAKVGINETAHHELTAIDMDGSGNLLTGAYRFAAIKRWSAATGVYSGQLIRASDSPKRWSVDPNFAGYAGYDNESMYGPYGMWNDGTYIYESDYYGGRVKKIKITTGQSIGWIGGITSIPTGGAAGCTTATPMTGAPGWCTGAWLNPESLWNQMIPQNTPGIMYHPGPVAGDPSLSDQYIYVADVDWHRINRYNRDTGAYGGWIGQIDSNNRPTGGATGCVNATGFTPGWCIGGLPSADNSGFGGMSTPRAMVYLKGYLYMQDNNAHMNKYNASTGAFIGWTGQINTTPTGGTGSNCSGAKNTVTNGWCTGGNAENGRDNGYVKGSFDAYDRMQGITTDGTYLYSYSGLMSRIDQYDTNGVYQKSLQPYLYTYTGTWSTNVTGWSWNGWGSSHMWADTQNLYIMTDWNSNAITKINLTTGTVVGWQGAILAGSSPTSGDPGCGGATGVTPGWCQGGSLTQGYTMGGLTGAARGITGDANYVYFSDLDSHRVTRLPK